MDKIKWYPIPCTRCGKEAGEVSNKFTGQITQALCPECVARSLEGKTELTRLREVEKWAREVGDILIYCTGGLPLNGKFYNTNHPFSNRAKELLTQAKELRLIEGEAAN